MERTDRTKRLRHDAWSIIRVNASILFVILLIGGSLLFGRSYVPGLRILACLCGFAVLYYERRQINWAVRALLAIRRLETSQAVVAEYDTKLAELDARQKTLRREKRRSGRLIERARRIGVAELTQKVGGLVDTNKIAQAQALLDQVEPHAALLREAVEFGAERIVLMAIRNDRVGQAREVVEQGREYRSLLREAARLGISAEVRPLVEGGRTAEARSQIETARRLETLRGNLDRLALRVAQADPRHRPEFAALLEVAHSALGRDERDTRRAIHALEQALERTSARPRAN